MVTWHTCEHRVSAAEDSPIPTDKPVTLMNCITDGDRVNYISICIFLYLKHIWVFAFDDLIIQVF